MFGRYELRRGMSWLLMRRDWIDCREAPAGWGGSALAGWGGSGPDPPSSLIEQAHQQVGRPQHTGGGGNKPQIVSGL